MSKFSERLKELRQERGLSINALSKQIGIDDATLGRWERGVRVPNIESLEILARFFGVSCDYLVGMED